MAPPRSARKLRPTVPAVEEEVDNILSSPEDTGSAPATATSAQANRALKVMGRSQLPAVPKAFAAAFEKDSQSRKRKEADNDNDESSDDDSSDDSDAEEDIFAGVQLQRKALDSLQNQRKIVNNVDEDSESDDEDDFETKENGGEKLFPTRLQPKTKSREIEKQTTGLLTNEEALCAPSGTALQQRDVHARKRGEKKDWHEMTTPELTPQMKMDLRALQLRNYMSASRFYKKNDSSAIPQKFQMGTIKEGLGEYKSHRLKKNERKPTFVDELLADSSVQSYTKRVYRDLQSERKRDPFSRKGKRQKTSKGGKAKH
eukprot:CAMPEP_0171523302 /NCGR_PEP_ID=MMETSP0959-20130129/8323_1 /TAXON_ID=87120 /ORGANISM="Aurantiochytrium limacinum, Strain ATCCMYA-1381" /LENGTH=314 /DNA_ID=CAMNT_0012063721 /DNA_START=13 /DNA_END=957 /DNA_ORIENTATION=-